LFNVLQEGIVEPLVIHIKVPAIWPNVMDIFYYRRKMIFGCLKLLCINTVTHRLAFERIYESDCTSKFSVIPLSANPVKIYFGEVTYLAEISVHDTGTDKQALISGAIVLDDSARLNEHLLFYINIK
jgi:hypothetical protein